MSKSQNANLVFNTSLVFFQMTWKILMKTTATYEIVFAYFSGGLRLDEVINLFLDVVLLPA